MDPDYPIVMRCDACGQLGSGPRSQLSEALREHQERCPARQTGEPLVTRLLYPRL